MDIRFSGYGIFSNRESPARILDRNPGRARACGIGCECRLRAQPTEDSARGSSLQPALDVGSRRRRIGLAKVAHRRWSQLYIRPSSRNGSPPCRARLRYNGGPRVFSLSESTLARRIEVHQAREFSVALTSRPNERLLPHRRDELSPGINSLWVPAGPRVSWRRCALRRQRKYWR